MNLKLAISCVGFFVPAGAAVTRTNHRTAIAVDANGGTSLIDTDVPTNAEALLQSLRGGLSGRKGATQLVNIVEDLAKNEVAKVGAGPNMDIVNDIKEFAKSILDHTNSNHKDDEALLQQSLAAIRVCGSTVAHLKEEGLVLQDEAGVSRDAHAFCREVEVEEANNRSSRCDEYDAYRGTIDSDINDCTSKWFLEDNVAKDEKVDPTTVENMESCLGQWTPWIEELHRLYLLCDSAAVVHDNQTAVCNEMQKDFEHGFCDWSNKLDDHCEQLASCYANAVDAQTTTHAHVRARQDARKSDWTAGSRIACYAKVFETVEPAEKQSTLSACQTEVITTDHLDLEYPPTPAKPTCTVVEAKPCDIGTWQYDEYVSKAWYMMAPTAECRPCAV